MNSTTIICRHLRNKFKLNYKKLHQHATTTEQNTKRQELHKPVMAKEVLDHLKPQPGQTIIDMTFGAGGHSRKLLETVSDIHIIALDRDENSYNIAKKLQTEYSDQVTPLLGKFSELPQLLNEIDLKPGTIDGILFDFGCNSMQFDCGERGFSIYKNGPLDMRMDGSRYADQPTIADVLAKIDEDDLARILKIYGEEKNAKKIARAIVDIRYAYRKLETTHELADVVAACFPEDSRRVDKLHRSSHLATKTFQALRIFINDELNEINYGMLIADKLLKCGTGRLVTLSFHSLEDTIVKRHLVGNLIAGTQANALPLRYCSHSIIEDDEIVMQQLVQTNWQQLTKHVLTPTQDEIDMNPRSRSAKLRAAVKIN